MIEELVRGETLLDLPLLKKEEQINDMKLGAAIAAVIMR